jgi:DNA ligase (NAD+)
LDKQSTIDEIEKWNNKPGIKGKSIVLSEKLDGISLEAIYEKGKFVKAITRGDGKQGDDITENAIYFNGMVKELQEPWDCSIRGEVVITKENLGKINTILVEYGKEPLKNTRNGVSGQATRYKDRNEDILSLITFLAYEVQVYKIHETGNNVL